MKHTGIIKKVLQAMQQASLMVAAKNKNTDGLRICIDPKNLNQALIEWTASCLEESR